MVIARKIRCVVVVAEAENDVMTQRHQPRFRPSDLLPWADPHIRSLIEGLQDEVREEESNRRRTDAATLSKLNDWQEPKNDSFLAAPGARRF